MRKPRPRLLFLSHSASRNGATIFLLHFVRWLREHSDYRLEVLVNDRDELLADFKTVARTSVWRNPASLLHSLPRRWRAAVQSRLEGQVLNAFLAGRHFDLVYANTAATWRQVLATARRSHALLWHIHELHYALRVTMGEQCIRDLFPLATRFVAASQAVRDALTQSFGVPPGKVDLVHECIAVPVITPDESATRRQRIRQELGWPNECFVVGGCGSLGWRKGTDLFLQMAAAINRGKGGHPVRFLWVGGSPEGAEALCFQQDLKAAGLSAICSWVPAVSNVSDYYCAMDVFALPSREDPFPLVMLEAAAHNLPMVCFAGSGGAPEFVGEDAGLVADYLDVPGFVNLLMRLHREPPLRAQLGSKASLKVKTNYSLEVQAPKFLSSIDRCLAAAQAAH